MPTSGAIENSCEQGGAGLVSSANAHECHSCASAAFDMCKCDLECVCFIYASSLFFPQYVRQTPG